MSKIIKTIDTCPVCQNPEMEVMHGYADHLNRTIHVENCPECGEHLPILLYDCELCKQAQQVIDTAAGNR